MNNSIRTSVLFALSFLCITRCSSAQLRARGCFMRSLFLSLLLFLPAIVTAQVVRIPDSVFRQQVIALGYDTNDDGKIQISEAQKVTVLNIDNLGIVNLEGINSFTNLEELNVIRNKITSLDVTKLKKLKYFYASFNPLSEINVAGLGNLEHLYFPAVGLNRTLIRSVNLSGLTNLVELKCSNSALAALDLGGLNKLELVECENSKLTSVSLRNAPRLKSVNLKDNPLQITVDIRGLTNLEYFNCEGCNLIVLNLSGTVKLKDLIW